MFLSACVLGCLFTVPVPAAAQSIDDLGVWTLLFANGDLHHHALDDNFKWWFDGHLRLFDDAGGFGQSIVRPGVGYSLTDSATAWAGYAWIRTSPGGGSDVDEHRAWQQLTWSQKLDPATLDFRSRLEQRFVETGSDTGWRFRQLAAFRRPLACVPQFTLVAWDEILFHLNDTDWGARDGFDQNRAFLGLGWKPHPDTSWRIETGYVHQFIDRPVRDDLSNHILSINLFWSP
jgi:hypothetical protein